MTTFFEGCIALIKWPLEVIDELNDFFGEKTTYSISIYFKPEFGQFIQVGDILHLDDSSESRLRDRLYVDAVPEKLRRSLEYLTFNGIDRYSVREREFAHTTIFLTLEMQSGPRFEPSFSEEVRKAFLAEEAKGN